MEDGNYETKSFYAWLMTTFSILPDERIAYEDKPKQMESGFGFNVQCDTTLDTDYDHPEKLLGPQLVSIGYPQGKGFPSVCYAQKGYNLGTNGWL